MTHLAIFLSPAAATQAAQHLWFDFDFSSTHTEFVDLPVGQNSVPQSPVTILSLGPTMRFDNGWFGGLRLRHFGPRPLIEDNSVRSDGTTQVNMQVGWRRNRLTLTMDIFNLFNSRDHAIDYYYESRLSTDPPGARIADRHFSPLEPFAIRGTAQWVF